MPPRQRLSAEDWTAAALAALAEGGLTAVAVERVATRLGVSKGSFYWHFADRNALLTAALASWERSETEDVIAHAETLPPGAPRLRLLLTAAVGAQYAASTGARVELALQPTAQDPLVAPVLARVAARRLEYLTAQFVASGYTRDEAHRRGLLTYSVYLGHAQLRHATPGVAPTDASSYVDTVLTALVPGSPRRGAAVEHP